MKIHYRDPQHLKNKYSPALRRVPELLDGSEEFKALSLGLKKVGFIRPIIIDQDDQVIDDHSRSQLRAAINYQFKEVPVQVCSSDDAPMVRLHSLAHVRHLSKSAIAYLAVPDLEEAFDLARRKKLKQIKEDSVVSSGDDLKTVDDLADELGIGRNLLFEARKVRAAFEDKKKYPRTIVGGKQDGEETEMTLREWYEPRMLRSFVGGEHEQNRPMGLGGILAGIAADKKPREDFNPKGKGQLSLFESKLDFAGGWKYWTKLSNKDRTQHLKNFEDQLEFIPEDQRDQLADYLEKLAGKVRKVVKEGK